MQYSQSITRVASGKKQSTRFLDPREGQPTTQDNLEWANSHWRNNRAPITSSGWSSDSATFAVDVDGVKSLIGWDLFDQLNLAVTPSSSLKDNLINNTSSSSELKKIAKNFPNLISRIGRSKNHVAKPNFHKDFQPRNQKGRCKSINLQDKVNNELKQF